MEQRFIDGVILIHRGRRVVLIRLVEGHEKYIQLLLRKPLHAGIDAEPREIILLIKREYRLSKIDYYTLVLRYREFVPNNLLSVILSDYIDKCSYYQKLISPS